MKKITILKILLITGVFITMSIYAFGLSDKEKQNFQDLISRLESSKVIQLDFENNVKDSSKQHLNGKLNKPATYTRGKKGRAIYLDGSNYIDLGTSENLQPKDLTFSVWIKVSGQMQGENMITWFKPNGNYKGKGWYLSSLNDNTPLKISIGESDGQPMEAFVTGSRTEFFPPYQWVYITVVFNSKNESVSIYRDGLAQNVSYLNNNTQISHDSKSHKYIGFNSPSYNGSFSKLFMDQLSIYNIAATNSEALALYIYNGGNIEDADIVDSDYKNLTFPITDISNNLELPSKGLAGSKIKWISSDETVLSTTGVVSRPADGDGDKAVTLTAALTYGNITKMKDFNFTIEEISNFKGASNFKISDVVVTDPYETRAFNNEIKYLKSLDADRLLKGFRDIAGIKSDAALYGGWESTPLKGHTMGHYLVALSQAYDSTGDEEILNRINYIIDSLSECQNKKTGYLAAIPENSYSKIEHGDMTGIWVPWYTMHKVLAGLIKVYEITGNQKALDIASKLGEWVYSRTSKWNETTQEIVLSVEYGGMNDALYELYSITKNKHFLSAAHSFDEKSLFDALYKGKDILNGLHANTTIPKIIGAVNRYVVLNDKKNNEYYLKVAENFWDIVINHHTYITGGNSEWEHFGPADVLDKKRTSCNCETCNVYNMLKLSRMLFDITGKKKYLDYYGTTFRNDILASQNPETGMTTYFQPMATGCFKVFSNRFTSFWCCTGTGMENFTKLGDSIYYKNTDNLYVAQFFDSEVTWKEKNLKIVQTSSIPEDPTTKLTIHTLKGRNISATIHIRVPNWCTGTMSVKLNGKAVSVKAAHGFIPVTSNFNDGDIIEVEIPMNIQAFNLPDGKNTYALKYGPLVLCAEMGQKSMMKKTTGVNVTIPSDLPSSLTKYTKIKVTSGTLKQWLSNINANVQRINGKLEFRLINTDCDYTFVPYYSEYKQRYGIYFVYSDK